MNHEWKSLTPGPFARRADVLGADPMWVWADATGYRDLGQAGQADPLALWCVVERNGVIRSELHAPADRADLADAELAMPVVPQRMPPAAPAIPKPPRGQVTPSSANKVLVGIIDSGCPFAAPMVRDARRTGTRVLGLWDQDEAAAFAEGGFRPPDLHYGRAIDRKGLNAFMAAARLPGGCIDEAQCYRSAGYTAVRTRLGHGAAVMSQLFAAPLHGGALQPRPGKRPSWDPAKPAIDRADLVFVQLPQTGQQDSTSGALARYLVDGLRFILSHAVKGQRVVVNISSGTSRTGHDGTSLIERGLAAAVTKAKRKGIDLHIVLPIGNTNMEQRHAVLSSPDSHLDLFLPPGCETPQYVTVRWPAKLQDAALVVTPPGGRAQLVSTGQALGWSSALGACAGVISPPAKKGQAARSLLAFAATHSDQPDYPRAPSGRWRIELRTADDLPLAEPMQFWVSRNQRNPGALPRGRQADFIDWDRSHHPRAWLRYGEDDLAPVRNGIRREGALSGLATASLKQPKILVVGSLFVNGAPDSPSPYSAAAKLKSGLPSVSAPGDTSRALRGLSVHGNHAGEVVRVLGTSFSAPLAARALVNGFRPKPGPQQPHPRVASVQHRP